MPEWIANPSWYIVLVLALVGAGLLWQGNIRQKKNLKLAGLGVAVLAMIIGAMSYFLESPTEIVTRKTKELARSVDTRDWSAFEKLLDPKVRFWTYNGRDAMVAGASKSAEQVGVKNITVSGVGVKHEPGVYIVDFSAVADVDVTGRRFPTNWRFYWSDKDYLLYRIDYVPNPQFGEDAIFSRLVPGTR